LTGTNGNDEAFARAKAETSRFLLDIGAVWCHWCHVIDRESYENPTISKLLTSIFVAIKWIVTSAPMSIRATSRHQRHFRPGWLAIDGIFAA